MQQNFWKDKKGWKLPVSLARLGRRLSNTDSHCRVFARLFACLKDWKGLSPWKRRIVIAESEALSLAKQHEEKVGWKKKTWLIQWENGRQGPKARRNRKQKRRTMKIVPTDTSKLLTYSFFLQHLAFFIVPYLSHFMNAGLLFSILPTKLDQFEISINILFFLPSFPYHYRQPLRICLMIIRQGNCPRT